MAEGSVTYCNLHRRAKEVAKNWLPGGPVVVGITAGASCLNNLIEETLIRLFQLRGIGTKPELHAAAGSRFAGD